eukprot:1129013-Amphidinium_carterae.1
MSWWTPVLSAGQHAAVRLLEQPRPQRGKLFRPNTSPAQKHMSTILIAGGGVASSTVRVAIKHHIGQLEIFVLSEEHSLHAHRGATNWIVFFSMRLFLNFLHRKLEATSKRRVPIHVEPQCKH